MNPTERQPAAEEAARILGAEAELRVWLGGRCIAVRRRAERWLAGAIRPPTGKIDLAVVCPESVDEAVYFADKLRKRLACDASVWVAVPQAPEGCLDAATAHYQGWSVAAVGHADGCLLVRLLPDAAEQP